MIGRFGIKEFLIENPEMQLTPSASCISIRGNFSFTASGLGMPTISQSYRLQIDIPDNYPRVPPIVYETGKQIPREDIYHVNQNGSLCLGSNLRLLIQININPSIIEFVKRCIIPYLYSVSRVLLHGCQFPFGELKHGVEGIIEDYAELFGLNSLTGINASLHALSLKKRIANKLPCPCSCKKRLGKCKFNIIIRRLRRLVPRYQFKNELHYLAKSTHGFQFKPSKHVKNTLNTII